MCAFEEHPSFEIGRLKLGQWWLGNQHMHVLDKLISISRPNCFWKIYEGVHVKMIRGTTNDRILFFENNHSIIKLDVCQLSLAFLIETEDKLSLYHNWTRSYSLYRLHWMVVPWSPYHQILHLIFHDQMTILLSILITINCPSFKIMNPDNICIDDFKLIIMELATQFLLYPLLWYLVLVGAK